MFGLGWAATPAGIRAIEELEKLEEERREGKAESVCLEKQSRGIRRGKKGKIRNVVEGEKSEGVRCRKGQPVMRCVRF